MAALTLLTLATSGCTIINNGVTAISKNNAWNETVTTLRTKSQSARSWLCRKQNFLNERHLDDFRKGYRAGYEAICKGGKDCPPAFPPSQYWGWEFQSAEGQARTAAWFAGYPNGVRAAKEEGNAQWSQLPITGGLQNSFQNPAPMYPTGPMPDVIGPATNFPAPNMSGAPVPAPVPENGAALAVPQNGLPVRSTVRHIQ